MAKIVRQQVGWRRRWVILTWLAKMSRLLLWEEEKLGRLTWLSRMSRLQLWEEEKMGKTHLVGQDVKAPVMGGR
jgi:hypothetical protein